MHEYNILITGASRGIGRAVFDELKNLGNVYVSGRDSKTLETCFAAGFCVCDLSKDTTGLEEFIKEKKSVKITKRTEDFDVNGPMFELGSNLQN